MLTNYKSSLASLSTLSNHSTGAYMEQHTKGIPEQVVCGNTTRTLYLVLKFTADNIRFSLKAKT